MFRLLSIFACWVSLLQLSCQQESIDRTNDELLRQQSRLPLGNPYGNGGTLTMESPLFLMPEEIRDRDYLLAELPGNQFKRGRVLWLGENGIKPADEPLPLKAREALVSYHLDKNKWVSEENDLSFEFQLTQGSYRLTGISFGDGSKHAARLHSESRLDDDSQFSWLLSLNHPKSEQTLLTVFFIEDQSLRTPDPLASPLPILIDQNQKISWPIRHLKLQACTPLDQRLKDGISKAVATWNAGLNGLLTIEFDGESISGDFSDLNTRCISEANPFLGGYGYANNIPATTYVVGSRHHSYLADADIFFWKGVHDQLDDDQLLSVAIHEVGHALILGEAKDESVMNSQLWLQQPQVLDIDRLHVLNE